MPKKIVFIVIATAFCACVGSCWYGLRDVIALFQPSRDSDPGYTDRVLKDTPGAMRWRFEVGGIVGGAIGLGASTYMVCSVKDRQNRDDE